MKALVECHSGFKYADKPRAFVWEGQRLEVVEITAEWRTPLSHCFRVRSQDGRWYELAYQELDGEWSVQPV